MADVFAYLYGFGAGGDFTKSVIIVTAPTGSTVTCTKGTTVKTATEKNGEWWFKNLDTGTWTVKATLSGQTTTQTVNITQYGVYRIAIVYRITPDFTYSGDYQVVQDNDAPISDFANWKGNWKIRFLTSGTFTVRNMYGWNGAIDVFLVGGGGGTSTGFNGGAGGGYTKTGKDISVQKNTPYSIVVGAGGDGADGGFTSAFSLTADGGKMGVRNNKRGGDGGSGGGGYHGTRNAGNGGADGSDGEQGAGDGPGGSGQGTTTREFGEPTGKLYSGGGGGGAYPASNGGDGGDGGGAKYATSAEENTGGGAGGNTDNNKTTRKGGSGIVIIRNAREVG